MSAFRMLTNGPTLDVVAQSIGFVGMAANIAMRAMTSDRRLRIMGVAATAVWTLHFVLLKAWVGASCNAIEGLVMLVSLGALPMAGRWALALLPVLAAPWLVEGLADALPIVSAAVCNLGMMFARGIGLRLVLLMTAMLWLVYDLASGSIGGVLTELISIGTLLATMWRMRQPATG